MNPAALVLIGLLVIWALESGRLSALIGVLTGRGGNAATGGAGASGGF